MSSFLLSEIVVKLVIYPLMLGHYLCEDIAPRPSFLKFQHHEGNVAQIINVTTKKYNVESIFT